MLANYTVYSDIDMTMGVSLTGDVAKKLNENSVKQSVKNIVMSPWKLFQPSFGPRINSILFEPENPITLELLRDEIQMAIIRHEDRVSDVTIEFSGQIDNNEIGIDIYFLIKEYEDTQHVSVVLEKIRS